MERILLASSSPRRCELLTAAGIPYTTLVPDIDESMYDALPTKERVLTLAEAKARAVLDLATKDSPRLVLAADTLVCLPSEAGRADEVTLGKPSDLAEAECMMRLLSGRSHFVRTGLALLDRESGQLRLCRSDSLVAFATMSEEEIASYLKSREWIGVAGGYRIQGLASFYVDRLEGSWTGVVGLPMRELYVILRQAGFRISELQA